MPDEGKIAAKTVLWARVKGKPGQPETILCGVTREALAEMCSADALHQFDLTKVGVPFRVAVFGAENLEQAQNKLQMALTELRIVPKDAVAAKLASVKL